MSPRGAWYRYKQWLAAGSLANKRNHVYTYCAIRYDIWCTYSLIFCRTFILGNILNIFVYGLSRNKRKEHSYVRRIMMQVRFLRIHRWRVVSPRGTWYRHKQQLAVGSLASKPYDVRTAVLLGIICAVCIH